MIKAVNHFKIRPKNSENWMSSINSRIEMNGVELMGCESIVFEIKNY